MSEKSEKKTPRLMKLNYGNLIRNIDEVLSKSRSRIVQENAFGIAMGINILNEYLRRIGERALEINDEVLIGLLKDLEILVESEETDEKKNQ